MAYTRTVPGLFFWDGYEQIDPVHYNRILQQCVLFNEMG